MKKSITIIFIVSSILVINWFKYGLIFGVAEDGLVFYNLSNYFHQAELTWMEYPGLGSPSLSLVAGKPTLFVLSFLQNIGIPNFVIQAIVLWLLLVSAGIGVYLLIKEFFPRVPEKYLLFGVFFYWFNPISLANVWNRFLLNYIFFFALIPLATYFYIKGLKSRKLIWAFILNIVLIVYSYSFSYIAFTFLLWIWFLLILIFYNTFNKEKKLIFFSIKYLSLNLLFFNLINSWWLWQLLFVYVTGGATPTVGLFLNQNIGLLDALSKTVGSLIGIFKLSNATFNSSDSLQWVKLYASPIFSLLMYIVSGTIVYSIIKLRKDSTILFIGALFLTSLFLSKGNNPPFGEIYNFVYHRVIFFQVFRNPFEKFGYLLSLTSAILLSVAIFELKMQTRGNLRWAVDPFFFVVIFFYLGFPFFTGLAFTNKFPPTNNYSVGYKVKVPDYYSQVNNFLVSKGNNFRYIGLPIKDEGITYNWEKGYAGVELNVALFTNSGVIHNTSVPFFNQVVPQIETSLLSNDNFTNLANLLNARYYILRYDIDYRIRQMTDPAIIEKKLKELELEQRVKHVSTIGKVSIWENLEWEDNTFYIAANIINVKDYNDPFSLAKINILNGDILLDDKGRNQISPIVQQKNNLLPRIRYQKIDSTHYIVHVKHSTAPFFLVFSELYNEGWKAFYGDNSTLSNHLRVNLFANGWSVERMGDFDISVTYTPQKWMDLGSQVSIVSYVLISFGCLFITIKRKL